MDEVHEFCRRVLGDEAAAAGASARALGSATASRVQRLAAAARECRALAELLPAPLPEPPGVECGLTEAVARELALANAELPERQREALALGELLRLSHDQIASVMGIEPAAVAPLLADGRLRLLSERRVAAPAGSNDCSERDRALRALVRRQDTEPLTAEDDAWLLAHLGECEECNRAHAAMLEASVCYRAWPASNALAPARAAAG